MHHPTDRIAHTMAFVTPVMEHWLEKWNGNNHLAQIVCSTITFTVVTLHYQTFVTPVVEHWLLKEGTSSDDLIENKNKESN